jgi:hypothetical protein
MQSYLPIKEKALPALDSNRKESDRMKIKDLFENWGLSSLKINMKFLEAEFNPNPEDEEAAWEMYVELITRTLTQELGNNDGDEKTALDSVYSLFGITREILKEKGRKCENFTKIAVIILNQIVRPFTAKWHKLELEGAFDDDNMCKEFRNDLRLLQEKMRNYSSMLAEIAKVEDITELNEGE